jgi:hypothetical protein
VGFAVHFEARMCKRWNHIQRLDDGEETFVAELHAAISALLLHDERLDFECYSDCESVVRLLNDRDRQLPRHPLQAGWLAAARAVQAHRDALGRKTSFCHVYSHLLDVPPEKRPGKDAEKWRKMREAYGRRTMEVLQGNQVADHRAKQSLSLSHSLYVMDMRQMPLAIAVDKATQRPLERVVPFLKQYRQTEHRKALLKKEKYEWIGKEGVDWKRSAAIHKNTSLEVETLQKHAHKSKHGFLAVKESRWEHRADPFFQRAYKGLVVTDPYCDACAHFDGGKLVEDKKHYLYCEAQRALRVDVTAKVRKRLSDDAVNPVHDIPIIYWNADERGKSWLPEEYTRVEQEFGPEDAAMGLVPKLWSQFAERLPRKENSDIEKLLADCQRIILQGCYDAWRKRCASFYQIHHQPRPPQPIVLPSSPRSVFIR